MCFVLFVYFLISEQYLSQHAHILDARVLPIFKDIADSRARNKDELDGKWITCYIWSVSTYTYMNLYHKKLHVI